MVIYIGTKASQINKKVLTISTLTCQKCRSLHYILLLCSCKILKHQNMIQQNIKHIQYSYKNTSLSILTRNFYFPFQHPMKNPIRYALVFVVICEWFCFHGQKKDWLRIWWPAVQHTISTFISLVSWTLFHKPWDTWYPASDCILLIYTFFNDYELHVNI